jgi:hypothetical protein
MNIFEAGKGINAIKINDNFAQLQSKSNSNESAINFVANNAILKDGTNLSQTIIDDFHKMTPIVLENQSEIISLNDNSVYFISLSGNADITLPPIADDAYSHTIVVYVQGHSGKSLTLGTNKYFFNYSELTVSNPYSIMYIYNKLDRNWYYSITQ